MIEFAQPAALWTALAVGLPILAHMAYRRVTQKYLFPSLRFIQPSKIPRTGRKKPTDLLLLLLRMILFLLFAVLLADPYWTVESSPEARVGEGKETVFAIDLSPSMGGWNGLDEAKDIALRLIQEETGRMGLVTFGQDITGEWQPGLSREELSTAVKNLEVTWKKGNAQVLMDRATALFSPSAPEKKLVVISDFQQSDWQTVYHDLSSAGVSAEIRRVGEGQGKRSGNLSVVEARAVPAGPGKVRVWTVIRNWDDEGRTTSLSLSAGGEIRQTQEVVLPPLGSAQSQFVLNADDFSSATVELESNDSFALDDTRSLWLKSPPAKRFGFWHSENEDSETLEERDFLKTAVSSAGDNGWNRWDWMQDQADGLRLGDENSNLELLLVIGLGDWFREQSLAPVMKDFLKRGGTAIVTPAQPFVKTVSAIKEAGLLDYKFLRVAGGAVRMANPFRIKALEEDSSLNQVFSGKSARDLYLSAIHRFGILQKIGEGTEIPISDRDGRPLALTRSFEGGGRIVFFPFRMNTSWTDLPLRNSFLPMIMELSFGSRKNLPKRAWPVLEPGQKWGEGEKIFKADQPGVFRFEDQWLEVVVAASESVPEVLSSEELKLAMGGGSTGPISLREGVGSLDEEREPLWLWFAIASACLLIVEMIWSRPSREVIEGGNTANA